MAKKTKIPLITAKTSLPIRIAVVLVLTLLIFSFSYIEEIFQPIKISQEGEPIIIYASQNHDDLRKLYHKYIQEATKTIKLYMYSFTDNSIATLLKEKAKEGVNISLICDKDSYSKTKQLLGKGIKVAKRESEGLMHLKILIIDESYVIIGSANFTNESLSLHHNNVCTANSPELAKYLSGIFEKLKKNNQQLGESIKEKEFLIGKQSLEVWLLSGNQRANKKVIELIDSAKKTIRVAMFTFTRYDFVYALLRAKKRGVTIEVAMDATQAKGASHHIATLLFLQNIPLKTSKGKPLLHHKCMIIDDNIFVTGSANWTKAAFSHNDDCFFVLKNLFPNQIECLQNLWKQIMIDTERYQIDDELDAA